jgi:predicted alpha/beta-fold hydrolase
LRKSTAEYSVVRCDRRPHAWEFDDTVTAPLQVPWRGRIGRVSRALRGSPIRIPTLVINAQRSFMPQAALETLVEVPANVVLEFPRTGGHAGFPGRNRWLARRVLEFLSAP